MSANGQPERGTQDRVIAVFREQLGHRYFGDWTDHSANGNITGAGNPKHGATLETTPEKILNQDLSLGIMKLFDRLTDFFKGFVKPGDDPARR